MPPLVVKNIFLFLLLSCTLLSYSNDAMGQGSKVKTTPKKTTVFYTVKNDTGQVTLYGKPLKARCKTDHCVDKVRQSDISKIRMGLDSYFELESPSGRVTLYGAANCSQPPCQPVVKETLVNKGRKRKERPQAELDQSKASLQLELDKEQLHLELDKEQPSLEKPKVPQQQKVPQKVNNKAKAGGGRR